MGSFGCVHELVRLAYALRRARPWLADVQNLTRSVVPNVRG